MFSKTLTEYAEEKFLSRKEALREIYGEIENRLKKCTEDEAALMKFLYGTMPIRDAGEYDFDIFLSYVRHAIFLRETMERCKNLPEDIFVHYVLYYRINSENITDCRKFFYDELKDRIAGKSDKDAVIEINYWCAENVTYESTDERTMSPAAVYKACAGRCGEESTFTVTAMRSVGIPARQVYTPWWAHCDDNHAWVEVYISGKWHFLGACEPEEVLNTGWFLGASGRSLLVYARTFSDFMSDSKEEYITKDGGLVYYNSTSTYTETRLLTVLVLDNGGNPVQGAEISIEILNMAKFAGMTTLFTDSEGKAGITIGKGDINIRVMKDGFFGERLVKITEGDFVEIILDTDLSEMSFVTDKWVKMDISAPSDKQVNRQTLTSEQKNRHRTRTKEAIKLRMEKEEAYYSKRLADEYPEQREILRLAKGNFNEVYKFLNKNDDYKRGELLKTLSVKDYKDLKADILESHLEAVKGELKDEIYFKNLLCPRIYLEEMTAFRSFINGYFDEETKALFIKKPYSIWEYIEKNIEYIPELDYRTICSTPVGCLKLKKGNPLSKKILFVAICRTLGIPAFLNKATLTPEYYNGDVFMRVMKNEEDNRAKYAELTLSVEDGSKWGYYRNYTLGVLRKDRFVTLDYEDIRFNGNVLKLNLDSGIYRLITTLRMPNGNQKAEMRIFSLISGEQKTVEMRLRESRTEDMLTENSLNDFEITEETGEEIKFSDIIKDKSGILAFLDEGKEPTEHVLNEMKILSTELQAMEEEIIFVVKDKEALKNTTLESVISVIPKIRVYYDKDMENVEPLARKMYVDPEKLPLLIALKNGLTGIYACSGYNVGSVDLMMKIMSCKK